MGDYNFGNTFNKAIDLDSGQIIKNPLCLNFGNLEDNKCDFIVLICSGKSYLSEKDLNKNCKGHSAINICCWYKAYKTREEK